MLTTTAARHDVIKTGCGGVAVDTAPSVTGENRAPGEGDLGVTGNPDEPNQPDNRGERLGEELTVHQLCGLFDRGRFVGQHKDQRAAIRYHAQRFVGGVQHQRMCHNPPSVTWDTVLGQQRRIELDHPVPA